MAGMDDLEERTLEERIAEVKHIKHFGEELGLEFGEAFTVIDLERPLMFYGLYVSYKDRFAIPLVRGLTNGRKSLFYTHRSSARRRQRQLEREGYETHLVESEALGNDDCPITRGLLEAKPSRRLDVVLHEGFHINCCLKADRDLAGCESKELRDSLSPGWALPFRLEEAIASVCGMKASLLYAKAHRPELVEDVKWDIEWWLKYSEALNRHYNILAACCEHGGDRTALLARAAEELGPLGEDEVNNAVFLRDINYTRDTPLAWDTFKDVDLRDYLADPTEIHAFLREQIGESDG